MREICTFTTYREFDDGVSPTQTFNISVYMHVWDFRLPTIPTLPTNFGLSIPFNTTLYNQTLEVFAQHSMMDWAFAPMPTVINLTSMGDIDTIDFTAMDAIYNYYHSFDTHSFGLFFSPSDALPTTDFIVNGQEYSATNYSASPQYNYTLAQYWLAVENHLKNMTYIDDFNDTISWYQETYYEGYDEVRLRNTPSHCQCN